MLGGALSVALEAKQGELAPSLTQPALEEKESGSARQLVLNHSKTAPRTFRYTHPSSAAGKRGGMWYPRQSVCEGVRHFLKYTTVTSAGLGLFVK